MWASCNKKWLDEGLAESCVSALGTSVSADFSTDRRPAPLSQRDSGTIHQSVTRHRYLRPLMDSLLAVEPSTMYRHGHMATNGFPSVERARCSQIRRMDEQRGRRVIVPGRFDGLRSGSRMTRATCRSERHSNAQNGGWSSGFSLPQSSLMAGLQPPRTTWTRHDRLERAIQRGLVRVPARSCKPTGRDSNPLCRWTPTRQSDHSMRPRISHKVRCLSHRFNNSALPWPGWSIHHSATESRRIFVQTPIRLAYVIIQWEFSRASGH